MYMYMYLVDDHVTSAWYKRSILREKRQHRVDHHMLAVSYHSKNSSIWTDLISYIVLSIATPSWGSMATTFLSNINLQYTLWIYKSHHDYIIHVLDMKQILKTKVLYNQNFWWQLQFDKSVGLSVYVSLSLSLSLAFCFTQDRGSAWVRQCFQLSVACCGKFAAFSGQEDKLSQKTNKQTNKQTQTNKQRQTVM